MSRPCVHCTFDLLFYAVISLGKTTTGHKDANALRPVPGEIYSNNQVVSGHGQGRLIWKYAMVIMIIGLLYKH